jgi:hypothetical protein
MKDGRTVCSWSFPNPKRPISLLGPSQGNSFTMAMIKRPAGMVPELRKKGGLGGGRRGSSVGKEVSK